MIEFGVLQFVVAVLGVFVGIIFGAIPGNDSYNGNRYIFTVNLCL